jgi:prepilin peptidase CpaA
LEFALNDLALVALSVLAIWLDLTRRKIPNLLTLPFMLAGLVYHALFHGWGGLWFALVGLLVGLLLLLLPFALGGVGGGDVKYLGAVGALQGASFVVAAFLIGAVLGGLLSLGYLAVKGRLGLTLRRLSGFLFTPLFRTLGLSFGSDRLFKIAAWFSPPPDELPKLFLPYGVPIAIGALLTVSGLVQRYLPGLLLWQ